MKKLECLFTDEELRIIADVCVDDANRDDLEELYRKGELPEYGTIEHVDDLLLALLQKRECNDCDQCYWHGGNCNDSCVHAEVERVTNLVYERQKKTPTPSYDAVPNAGSVKCKDCVYCSTTSPRICMHPEGFAKHSYVTDDDYCSKGEGICKS